MFGVAEQVAAERSADAVQLAARGRSLGAAEHRRGYADIARLPRTPCAFPCRILFGVSEHMRTSAATTLLRSSGWEPRRKAPGSRGASAPEGRARAAQAATRARPGGAQAVDRGPGRSSRTKNNGAGGGVGAVVVHQWVGGGGGRPTLRRGVFVMSRGPLPPGCPCPGPRSLGPAELKRGDVQDDQRSQCDDQGSQRVHLIRSSRMPLLAGTTIPHNARQSIVRRSSNRMRRMT